MHEFWLGVQLEKVEVPAMLTGVPIAPAVTPSPAFHLSKCSVTTAPLPLPLESMNATVFPSRESTGEVLITWVVL